MAVGHNEAFDTAANGRNAGCIAVAAVVGNCTEHPEREELVGNVETAAAVVDAAIQAAAVAVAAGHNIAVAAETPVELKQLVEVVMDDKQTVVEVDSPVDIVVDTAVVAADDGPVEVGDLLTCLHQQVVVAVTDVISTILKSLSWRRPTKRKTKPKHIFDSWNDV